MPEGTTAEAGRTFTEGEAYALVADAVGRETAGLAQERDGLTAKVAEQASAIDVLETEKAAAVQRAEQAEQALADYQAEQAATAAREALRSERVRAFQEANPYLEVTQERSDRMVAMSEEDFASYLADMRELAGRVTPAEEGAGTLPQQSAAFHGSTDPDGASSSASLSGLMSARRSMLQTATKEG